MSRKTDFLEELEALCKKYDSPQHEVEFYAERDGDDPVISVFLPKGENEDFANDFYLSSRPFIK